MSSGLIALLVALALGAAVVGLGLRRNLSEVTRDGLPRFEGESDRTGATLGLYEGEERPRRLPSLRERRFFACFFLVFALMQAVPAVLSSEDRLIHGVLAVLMALVAVGYWLGKLPIQRGAPAS